MISLIGSQKITVDFMQQFATVSAALGRVGESSTTLTALLDADSRLAGRQLVEALEKLGADWLALIEYLPLMFAGDTSGSK